MKRPYSEHNITEAKWLSAAVLALVTACTAAIVNGWPL